MVYGPYDPTDRLYYWLHQVKCMDELLLPDNGGTTRAEVDLSGFAQGVHAINLSASGSVIGSGKISVAGR